VNRFRGSVLLLVVLSVFSLTQPVLAISDPDSIELISLRVYNNVYEAGDWLILCEADVAYNTTPSEDSTDTFGFFLDDGSGIVAAGEVISYGHNLGMIYLGSSDVSDLGLTWENASYNVSVMGLPAYFPIPVEDVSMDTKPLTGCWIDGTTEENRGYLGNRIILLAALIEDDWGEDWLSGNNKLNELGREQVLTAIPYLNLIIPDIFEPVTTSPDYTPPDYDPEYENTLLDRTGERLTNVLNGLGEWITGKENMGLLVGGLGLAILYFILAGRIFVATGSVPASVAISIPFLIGGNLIGILPLSITFIAAFFAALFFGITFILGRF
jgi:hypothetical protein